MKTTFDLPDLLLRKAKALAANQGRPLRDLVAEAIDEKLRLETSEPTIAPRFSEGRRKAWEQWKARLVKQPDGTWFNTDGIDDESFFQALDDLRRVPWVSRNPFSGSE